MARYIGPSCRICRREGMKLFLKGTKCTTPKCPVSRRAYAPGQHGKGRLKKLSDYGVQLREKQKLRKTYGLLEKQFKHYFRIASKSKGVTGAVLLQLLERRLDNVVFRLGFAHSRAHGRQLVRHGLITVGGKKVNLPSYFVNVGNKIGVQAQERIQKHIRQTLETVKERGTPSWLEMNPEQLVGTVLRFPDKQDSQIPVKEQLIVELYSK